MKLATSIALIAAFAAVTSASTLVKPNRNTIPMEQIAVEGMKALFDKARIGISTQQGQVAAVASATYQTKSSRSNLETLLASLQAFREKNADLLTCVTHNKNAMDAINNFYVMYSTVQESTPIYWLEYASAVAIQLGPSIIESIEKQNYFKLVSIGYAALQMLPPHPAIDKVGITADAFKIGMAFISCVEL